METNFRTIKGVEYALEIIKVGNHSSLVNLKDGTNIIRYEGVWMSNKNLAECLAGLAYGIEIVEKMSITGEIRHFADVYIIQKSISTNKGSLGF